MPTLTIDLPDAAYRAAVALPEADLSRLIAHAIEWEDEEYEDPTLPDYDRPTNAADLETIGRGLEDVAAGRVIPGDVVFARLQERFGKRAK